jgi:hypothetical protein
MSWQAELGAQALRGSMHPTHLLRRRLCQGSSGRLSSQRLSQCRQAQGMH